MQERKRRQVFTGLTLIVLGLALYLLEYLGDVDRAATFFLIGGAFLAAYFYHRQIGFLIPGSLALGMGIGRFTEAGQMIGLGIGFIGITVLALAYQRQFHWWPLIPGVAMILIKLEKLDYVRKLFQNWPLLLVIVGVLILISALARKPAKGES